MATFHFRTPDQRLLTFEKVPKAEVLAQVARGAFAPTEGDFPWQAQEAVYVGPSGHSAYAYGARDYGHVFAPQAEWELSITGTTYTTSTLLYDRHDQHGTLRCAFDLDFDAALPLVNLDGLDAAYPSYEGYRVYGARTNRSATWPTPIAFR
jgi:hypothetical protein